jgi:hypothetical protein
MPKTVSKSLNAEVLDKALVEALYEGGFKYDPSDPYRDAASIVSGVVSLVPEVEKLDLYWYAAVLAIVPPLVELIAAVATNPLGDNSTAGKNAIAALKSALREHAKLTAGDIAVEARASKKSA